MSSQCETEIKDCIHLYKKHVYKDRKEKIEKKQHMERQVKEHTTIYMKTKYKYNVCQNGHKTNIQDVIYLKWKKIH